MAKSKTTRKTKSEINLAAEEAAREALLAQEREELAEEFPDEADMADVDDDYAPEAPNFERDIFTDAFKKAQGKNDIPRYYIYKNSAYIAVKPYPYSWEKLQAEYGEGHYKIVAKSLKTGQNLMVQSELVGNPHPEGEETEQVEELTPHNGPIDPLVLMNFNQQQQDRAEQKAQVQASSQAHMFTTMLTTVMQMQQQATQQFQMMMMEQQKQAQAQAQAQQNLLLTLLTKDQGKKDDGMNPLQVMKLIQDAEHNTEKRTKDWFDLVERKAEKMAEEKAEAMSSGEGEESLAKTLLKGFTPVIAQVLANGGAPGAQPQPTQLQAQQMQAHENARQLELRAAHERKKLAEERAKRTLHEGREASNGKVPDGFTDDSKPGQKLNGKTSQGEQSFPQNQPVVVNLQKTNGLAKGSEKIVRGGPVKASDDGKKVLILNLVKTDIGQALVSQKDPGKTAEACLKKLEKAGHPRQTVAEAFTLEDFYRFASDNGVPEIAKPWLGEFYQHVQKAKSVSADGKTTGAGTQPHTLTQNI